MVLKLCPTDLHDTDIKVLIVSLCIKSKIIIPGSCTVILSDEAYIMLNQARQMPLPQPAMLWMVGLPQRPQFGVMNNVLNIAAGS